MWIKVSNEMNTRKGLENKLIRMPKVLREKLGVTLGEFICLENDVILQIDMPFVQDMITYGTNSAFVTENTFHNIGEKASKYIEIVDTITMGCDPEFFVVNYTNNELVDPNTLFKKFDAVGTDGMLAELRPIPHINPNNVVETLREMINATSSRFKQHNLPYNLIGSSAAFGLTAGISPQILVYI